MQRFGLISRFVLALVLSGLLCISVVIPPAGVALAPLSAQPALSFGLRYGITWGVGMLLLATALFTVLFGQALGILYGFFALLAGMFFSFLGRIRSIEYLVLGISAVQFLAMAGFLYLLFGSWSTLEADFQASAARQVAAALAVQEKMGWSAESITAVKERLPEAIAAIILLLPALLFIGIALIVFINLVLLLWRFPERRPGWLSLDSLRHWKAPEYLVWGLIVCGFGMFVPGLEWLRVIAANLLLIIGSCYFAQGLAVIAFFFHKNKVPRFLRGVTYVLIVFQQIFTLLVVGLGLFDLWGDFRRLSKDNLTPRQAA